MALLRSGQNVAQGGDWGAGVTTWMAKQHVEGLAAIHLNLPILFPPPVEGEPNQAEKATIAQLVAFNDKKSGYAKIQSTRPQTIGYALADSPAGQAAWIYEKLGEWTDSNYEPEREISRDEMLDNISLYWLTNTATTSARLYYESFATDFSTQRLDLPVAVSIFPGELFRPPRLWGERVYSRLVYWNEAARGGHFAAFEQPTVFVEELRAAFRALLVVANAGDAHESRRRTGPRCHHQCYSGAGRAIGIQILALRSQANSDRKNSAYRSHMRSEFRKIG
jgi:pimeloyl-ACP methyl ester carboxylesterase